MRSFVFAVSVALAVLISVPAAAQQRQCTDDYGELRATLETQFGEFPVFAALDGSEGMTPGFQLFGNPETETWTLVRIGPRTACIVASGVGYEVSDIEIPRPSRIS